MWPSLPSNLWFKRKKKTKHIHGFKQLWCALSEKFLVFWKTGMKKKSGFTMSSTLKSFADVARSKRHNGAKYFSKSHTSQLTRYFLNVIIQLNKEILEDILLKKEIFGRYSIEIWCSKVFKIKWSVDPKLAGIVNYFCGRSKLLSHWILGWFYWKRPQLFNYDLLY